MMDVLKKLVVFFIFCAKAFHITVARDIDYTAIYQEGSPRGYFIAVAPYLQHPDNPHERFSGSWIEFEASHPNRANFYLFESINPEKVRADLLRSGILNHTEESIKDYPRQWESALQEEMMNRLGHNLGKVGAYRHADRVAVLPTEISLQYEGRIMDRINAVCPVPPSQRTSIIMAIRHDFYSRKPLEVSAQTHIEKCQQETKFSQGIVLSRWYVDDFTGVVKDYGIVATDHPSDSSSCATDGNCRYLLEFRAMIKENPITLRVLREIRAFVEEEESIAFSDEEEFIHQSNHFHVQEMAILPNPGNNIYLGMLGRGGGNDYWFFFVEGEEGELKLVYADYDGEILYASLEFHIDNFKDYSL